MKAMSSPTHTGNDAGFSLLEVLLALLLVSIMALSMSAMTGQFRQLIDNTDRNGESTALQAAARHIARQLEQAETMAITETASGVSPYMHGERGKVSFVAVTRLGVSSEGLRNLKFKLADDGRLVQLSGLRRQSDDKTQSETASAVILQDVQALEFAYFGSPTDNGALAWHENWTTVGRLPQAVSVTVRKSAKGDRPLTATGVAWLSAQ